MDGAYNNDYSSLNVKARNLERKAASDERERHYRLPGQTSLGPTRNREGDLVGFCVDIIWQKVIPVSFYETSY
jgi:hypothetical protein